MFQLSFRTHSVVKYYDETVWHEWLVEAQFWKQCPCYTIADLIPHSQALAVAGGGHGGHGPPFGSERWGHTIFWPPPLGQVANQQIFSLTMANDRALN